MANRTILSKREIATWLNTNDTTLEHKWSSRGMGNSKILHRGGVISRASGCGYDRYGTVLGGAITELFPAALVKLAVKECKTKGTYRKSSKRYYGLFLTPDKKQASLDGGCGSSCMVSVLNRIGFGLSHVGDTDNGQSGSTFYTIRELTDHERKYL